MKVSYEENVWIAVGQRLDGLRSRSSLAWPEPYITVTLGKNDPVEFTITPALARQLATGLRRAAKRAEG